MVAYDTWHAPVRECVCEAVRLTLFACTLLFGYLLGYLVSVACFPPQNQMSCHCMSFTKVRPVEVLDQSFIRSNDSLGRPPLYSPSLACRVVPYKTPLFFQSLSVCTGRQHSALRKLEGSPPQVLTLTR